MDDLVDLIAEALDFLDARAGAGADVQQELARIHGWKKVVAQRLRQQPRSGAENQEKNAKWLAMLETAREQRAVTFARSRSKPFSKAR